MIDLINYPPYTECFYVYTDLQNVLNASTIYVKYEFIKEATQESLFVYETEYPAKTGRPYTHVCSIAWIGTWPHEINEPGRYLCEVSFYEGTSYNGKILVALNVVDSSLEPPEPEPGECPDFWTDPVGAVLCWMISGLEAIWGFTLDVVKDTVLWIQEFQLTITTEFWKFLQDPIKYIQDTVDSLIPVLSDWWEDIISGVDDWWTTTKEDIGDWWSSASKAVGDWVDSSFSNIGSWWESVRSSVVDWMQDQWNNATDFWNDVTSNIGQWWDDTKKAIWDGLQSAVSGLESWVDSAHASIGDWWGSVSTGIGEWWSSTIEALGKSWDDFASGIGDVWDGIVNEIGDAIDTAVVNIQNWVNDVVPGIVEAMFDWAKPAIQPVIDAVGFLGEITGIITKKKPEDPVIREYKDEIQFHKDELQRIKEKYLE